MEEIVISVSGVVVPLVQAWENYGPGTISGLLSFLIRQIIFKK